MNMRNLKANVLYQVMRFFILLIGTSACMLNASELEETQAPLITTTESSEAVGERIPEPATLEEQKPVFEPEQPVALSVEQLKKKVIQLNRDLFILEEDLLFPANTQFVVYLSLDTGEFLNLDSVTLKIDDQVSAAHLYTERQIKALQRGGMQRLHLGNLKEGKHQITAIVNGIGPDNRAYKRAASLDFEKDLDIKSLEVRIEDQAANFQPNVSVIEWDAAN